MEAYQRISMIDLASIEGHMLFKSISQRCHAQCLSQDLETGYLKLAELCKILGRQNV